MEFFRFLLHSQRAATQKWLSAAFLLLFEFCLHFQFLQLSVFVSFVDYFHHLCILLFLNKQSSVGILSTRSISQSRGRGLPLFLSLLMHGLCRFAILDIFESFYAEWERVFQIREDHLAEYLRRIAHKNDDMVLLLTHIKEAANYLRTCGTAQSMYGYKFLVCAHCIRYAFVIIVKCYTSTVNFKSQILFLIV